MKQFSAANRQPSLYRENRKNFLTQEPRLYTELAICFDLARLSLLPTFSNPHFHSAPPPLLSVNECFALIYSEKPPRPERVGIRNVCGGLQEKKLGRPGRPPEDFGRSGLGRLQPSRRENGAASTGSCMYRQKES